MHPEFVREYGDVIFAVDAFFGQEVATEEEGTTEHFVEANGSLSAVDVLRFIFGRGVEGSTAEGVDVLKARVEALPVEEICGGHGVVEGLNLRPDNDELVGLGIR